MGTKLIKHTVVITFAFLTICLACVWVMIFALMSAAHMDRTTPSAMATAVAIGFFGVVIPYTGICISLWYLFKKTRILQ